MQAIAGLSLMANTQRETGPMFVETITSPAEEWHRWNERLRMLTDPPAALVASIAWRAGNDQISAVNVWDTAEAIGDFFVERVHPIVSAEGEPPVAPSRHGEPVAFYLRR
jgi:hypothetical protein